MTVAELPVSGPMSVAADTRKRLDSGIMFGGMDEITQTYFVRPVLMFLSIQFSIPASDRHRLALADRDHIYLCAKSGVS